MPTFWARMIGRFFDAVMAKPVASFRRGLERPFEAQETALRQILSSNRDTEFGRSHRFDQVLAASDIWQAYRSAVPIRNYDGFGESIEKMKNAEPDVLIPGVADMFSLTSGTTSLPKFCPVNRTFILEHHRQHLLWMYHVYKDHPICNSGKYLVVASPAEMGRTNGNIPYGAMSGKQLDIQSIPVRRRMAAPALVQHIADPEERWFNFILFALAEPELRVVTAVNPSSLVVIAQRLEKDAEKYIDCIKNGLPPDGISGSRDPAAMKLATMFKPNPPRAAALAERWRAHGILTPAMAWPGLEMLLTWQGGSSAFYLPHVESLWGGTSRRCLGLRASEGTFSIPLEDGTASAALAVGGHAMEFIPAEIDQPAEHEPTLLAGELEEGRLYRLIISTSGGFYRYDMADLVRVTGFRNNTPEVAFERRAGSVLSATGEKVTEDQVAEAMAEAIADSILLNGFTLTWEMDGSVVRYVLAVETAGDLTQQQSRRITVVRLLNSLVDSFDHALAARNVEYKSKRDDGRLAPPRLIALHNGSYAKWRSAAAQAGRPENQVKQPMLIAPPGPGRAPVKGCAFFDKVDVADIFSKEGKA